MLSLSCLLLLIPIGHCFQPKDNPAVSTQKWSVTYVDQTKLHLFGHGYLALYSTCSLKALIKNEKIKTKIQPGMWRVSRIILVLVLLEGDIHLNPRTTSD